MKIRTFYLMTNGKIVSWMVDLSKPSPTMTPPEELGTISSQLTPWERYINSDRGIFEGDTVEYTFPSTPHQKGIVVTGKVKWIPELASYRVVNSIHGDLPIHDDVRLILIGRL